MYAPHLRIPVPRNAIEPQSSRKEVWSWAFYDFANSSYGSIFLSLLFPVFYRDAIAGGGGRADFFWGLAVGVSVILAALASPVIGALADRAKNKKELLTAFTLASVLGTAALWASPALGLAGTTVLFILTNFAYTAGLVVYDAFLQDIAARHNRGHVSGLGWGLGYIGGLAAMAVLYPLYRHGFGGPHHAGYLLTFPLIAAFFLIFALPSLVFLRSHRHLATHKVPAWRELPEAWRSLADTLRNWRKHRNILLFLLAFYLLNDGLNTVFSFISIYLTATLGLSMAKVALVFVLTQLIAAPATIITGRLADRSGAKPVIMAATTGWIVVVGLFLLRPTYAVVLIAAVLAGIVVGSSQAPARALLAKLVPADKSCQFFGLNGLASKISASFGPIIFGAISWATGSQQWALASILLFFAGSILVLRLVHEPLPARAGSRS
jgi:UMF1 family MFS transporter